MEYFTHSGLLDLCFQGLFYLIKHLDIQLGLVGRYLAIRGEVAEHISINYMPQKVGIN